MRKALGGIAVAAVLVAGGVAVVAAPDGGHKASVNDISGGTTSPSTGSTDVFVTWGALTGESDPTLSSAGIPVNPADLNNNPSYHEVRGFTTSQEQTLNIGSTTAGAGAGKVAFNALELDVPVDSSYPKLFASMAAGKSTPFVHVLFRKPGGAAAGTSAQPFMEITLKLAAISKLELDPSASGLNVHVVLQYGAYQTAIYTQNADGSYAPTPTQAGWNRVMNISDPTWNKPIQ